MTNYANLKSHFSRIHDLSYLAYMLDWDESVMMPNGAGEARATAMATFSRLMHEQMTNKDIQNWLTAAKQENLTDWDAANLIWMEKLYQRANCVPADLAEAMTKAKNTSQHAWRQMRAENNWRDFYPLLEKTFALTKEAANIHAQTFGLSAYDALLDQYAPGFNQQRIDAIFKNVQETLPALTDKIIAKQAQEKTIPLSGTFSIAAQKQLGEKVMAALHFDFEHGRLDISHHPFSTGIATDSRITTRYQENEFLSSLSGICHETGHALYTMGGPKSWLSQPVGQVDHSMAMHESQSLLIERQLCLSKSFFEYIAPTANNLFGAHESLNANNLFKLSTRVDKDFIRVDADEVTYPLHVILRYEIEKKLFNDEIQIRDLPDVWNELSKKYLGLDTKDNHKNGAMQDVHWPAGAFGYFPAYSLGDMISAQLFASFEKSHPIFFEEVERGNFKSLINWLRENVHSVGSRYTTDELLTRITGEPLNSTHFIKHIEKRYLS